MPLVLSVLFVIKLRCTLYASDIIKPQNFKGCCKVFPYFGISNISALIERRDRIVTLLKPDPDWIKLNTYGSYNGKVAGCGGILRNHFGKVIYAFAGPVSGNYAFLAELHGLIYGISICIKLGFNRVWIEVDAMLILHYLNSSKLFNAENFYLIRQLKQDLSNINFKITHIFHEGNGCADALAKLGCNYLDYCEFHEDEIPMVVKGLARLDRAGLPYIRHH
ncbi:Putative ribonuclease H protein [Dendrobium catenatum]|uniref:Ribonuclease H protein n=1 Tax=Dendrobium catenatum TaxID=906689 RepID=A0A2I0WRX5_9ASPA|nr:Putative ribonuclease H protein [Dendrobium catenatum]